MNGRLYLESLKATAKTGTMIIFLVIAGFCLSFVLSYMGVATKLAETIVGLGANRWIIMILLYILWFILGCLMDPASMVILTIPFIYPTLTALNFAPIWIGVVSTFCVEIGMITPPVGLNLFILRSTTSIEMRHILKGSSLCAGPDHRTGHPEPVPRPRALASVQHVRSAKNHFSRKPIIL
jgi:C4-dicarboxylate transporter DctM subunit